jgi:hypothetical protein
MSKINVKIDGKPIHAKSFSGGKGGKEKAVSLLKIQSFITPDQKILANIANRAANKGEAVKVKIRIEELGDNGKVQKTHIYSDCLMVSLDYPQFKKSGDGHATETAVFQASGHSTS